jgi:hypothetical protein
MADNPSEPPKATPPLPSSGMKGVTKAPTTKLPNPKASTTGKVVVMLSSTSKMGSAGTQRLLVRPSPTRVPAAAPPAPTPASSAPVSTAPPASPAAATPAAVVPPPKVIPGDASTSARKPPPLPPKQVTPAPQVSAPRPGASPMPKATPAQPRLSATTFVKLPPKTAVPALVSLTGQPLVPAEKKELEKLAPPLLPAKGSEPIKSVLHKTDPVQQAPPLGPAAVPAKGDPKKTGPITLNQAPPLTAKGDVKRTAMIKLNAPVVEASEPGESIFLQDGDTPGAAVAAKPATAKPEGWKNLQPGELPQPAGGLKDLEVFARSQRFQGKPAPTPSVVEAKDKPAPVPAVVAPKDKPILAPPLTPPRPPETPSPGAKTAPALNPAPVVLPAAKPVETPATHPLHVAPPMVEKAGEEAREKLPPPHLPEPAKSLAPEAAVPPVHKAPAMIGPEAPPSRLLTPPSLPAVKPTEKPAENKLKKSAPIVLSASQLLGPAIAEAKPALKPAVLPKRSVPIPEPAEKPLLVGEAKPAAEKPQTPAKTDATVAKGEPVKAGPEVSPAATTKAPLAIKLESTKAPAKEKEAAKEGGLFYRRIKPSPALTPVDAAAGAVVGAAAVAALSKKPTLPPTRAERAKKRRFREAAIFWVAIVPVAAAILFFGILHFGRDTRVEGQVIPPEGMSLNDEVWIVTNFSTDASGIADDLAKERTPIQQEIQERRDHVQRAQADIAAREERIRLIQGDIQSAKDEINGIVKKSRDDAQAIWDGEGAEIGQEYDGHKEALRKAIADRAASLKLPYNPDPAFPAPEVWANAFRIALYDTPPGVDGAKEHQWLADQMKVWRDFEKSLDDRKEQLREKAAALKLKPAPRLADLNTKIDDLNQRILATQGEEEPLKIELQQAQADLAAAQEADTGLDDKFYKQLYSIPSENVTYHIPVHPNGRFTWIPDTNFAEGEKEHRYWIFSRATRADGRQYWALHNFPVDRDRMTEVTIEPGAFESTKAILRPNLPPDEIEQ